MVKWIEEETATLARADNKPQDRLAIVREKGDLAMRVGLRIIEKNMPGFEKYIQELAKLEQELLQRVGDA